MMLRLSKGNSQPCDLRDSYVKPLTTIHDMVSHASAASSKPKVELDPHADVCVVGDNYIIICDHNRSINNYSYDPKDGHRNVKAVDTIADYQDL